MSSYWPTMTRFFAMLLGPVRDFVEATKQALGDIASQFKNPGVTKRFFAVPLKILTTPFVAVASMLEGRAKIKAHGVVAGLDSCHVEGKHRGSFFRSWTYLFPLDSLTKERFSWIDKKLSVYSYGGGTMVASLHRDQAELFHEHDRMQYVRVKLFGLIPYWFQLERNCAESPSFTLKACTTHFWWMLAVIHNSKTFDKIDLSDLEKFLLPPGWDSSVATWSVSALSLRQTLDTLSPDYDWVDLHNLYYHPNVFAADHDFEGIPGEYIRKVLGVPEKL